MDLVGQVVADRYRVMRSLGSGAMGLLFEVENTKIGRRFALKTLTSDLARKDESLARFRREAEIVARLNHPNIVSIVDWDTLPGGQPFYVMELLEGEDLGHRIARGVLPLDEFGVIAAQAMAAVAEAHRNGVLHRDLKPANLFLCRVPESIHVKVLDFGLARGTGAPAITQFDRPMWIGTPAYMSPEQIAGDSEPGQKADVWAMGAVLFEMLTGRQAFEGPLDKVVGEIRKGDPPRLAPLRGDIPDELAGAVEAAMTRGPDRITTIDELAARVRAALGVHRHPITSPPPLATPAPTPKVQGKDDSASTTVAETAGGRRSSRAARRRVRAWVWVAFASALVAVASAVVAVVAIYGSDTAAASDAAPAAASESTTGAAGKAATIEPTPAETQSAAPAPDAAPPAPVPVPTSPGVARGRDFSVVVPPLMAEVPTSYQHERVRSHGGVILVAPDSDQGRSIYVVPAPSGLKAKTQKACVTRMEKESNDIIAAEHARLMQTHPKEVTDVKFSFRAVVRDKRCWLVACGGDPRHTSCDEVSESLEVVEETRPVRAPEARDAVAPDAPQKTPQQARALEHYARGSTDYNLGRFDAAVESFSKAYEVDPQPVYLYYIARALGETGNCTRALMFYRRYRSLEPTKLKSTVDRHIRELSGRCGKGEEPQPESAPEAKPKPDDGELVTPNLD